MHYLLLFLRALLGAPACLAFIDRIAFADYTALLTLNSEAAEADQTLVLTTNATAIEEGGDEWVQISPWGEYNHPDGRQVVNAQTVQGLVTRFSDEKQKKGRNFRGLPIYGGKHPTRDDLKNGIKPIGKIMDLQARSDGLYGQRKLNRLGKENDENDFWSFPSVGWWTSPNRDGTLSLNKIDHVAMVPNPNIKDVPAWTQTLNDGANITIPPHIDMDPKLCALLGLDTNTSPEQILAHIASIKQKLADRDAQDAADATKKEAAEAGKEGAAEDPDKKDENSEQAQLMKTYNQAVADLEESQKLVVNEKTRADNAEAALKLTLNRLAESATELAIREGKIAKADKPAWMEKLTTNAETAAELQALKPKYDTTRLTLNRTPETVGSQKEASEALSKLTNDARKANGRLTIVQAHNQVINDPANAELVKLALG